MPKPSRFALLVGRVSIRVPRYLAYAAGLVVFGAIVLASTVATLGTMELMRRFGLNAAAPSSGYVIGMGTFMVLLHKFITARWMRSFDDNVREVESELRLKQERHNQDSDKG